MKLTDLDPRFENAVASRPSRCGVTLSFACPCATCAPKALRERYRIELSLSNPLDGGEPYAGQGLEGRFWTREGNGSDLATLTIAEAIDFSLEGHWAGRVTGGEVVG
jgi:hypothetical protein